ncbi:hypothetical protein C8J37_1205 [Rhizobium sp. PP-WC-1G-195]|nr:hypothetical protein C8J37_1205 [Rhizobium sp. PP-WC-1G-195]
MGAVSGLEAGRHVDDETVANILRHDPLVGAVDLVGFDHLDIGMMLRAAHSTTGSAAHSEGLDVQFCMDICARYVNRRSHRREILLATLSSENDLFPATARSQPPSDVLLGDAVTLLHVPRVRSAIDIGCIKEVDADLTRLSMIWKLVASSVNSPKFMVPRQSGPTLGLPGRDICIPCQSVLILAFSTSSSQRFSPAMKKSGPREKCGTCLLPD